MFRAAAQGRDPHHGADDFHDAEEMRAFRAVVEEFSAEVFRAQVSIGMMIEVPSAAFAVSECAASR